MSEGELAVDLNDDAKTLRYLDQSMKRLALVAGEGDLMSRSVAELSTEEKLAIKGNYAEFLQTALELDLIQEKYKGFYPQKD